MKLLVYLCAMLCASTNGYLMKLSEKGEQFIENVLIDVEGNTEEIQVPKHQDRAALDMLNDFTVGLSAKKLPDSKRCYISKIDASEQRPAEMKQSMELAKSQFPAERYTVETFKVLVIRKMSREEVGEKIAAHCNGYDLLFTMAFNKENIEEEALKIVKNARVEGIRKRRDLDLVSFDTCNNESAMVADTCPSAKLAAKCTFFRNDQRVCAYRVVCRRTVGSTTSFAKCVGTHRFDLMQCCDFVCRT